MAQYYVGVDVGGTTVKMGMFSDTGELLDKWEIPTRRKNNGKYILSDIVDSIEEKRETFEGNIKGIGVGIPGPVTADGTVLKCANLGWDVFSVSNKLASLTGVGNVKVGNDANVAALGEMWKGGGRGYDSIVMVTLGTGVGGGVILQGKILTGCKGAGGEIGHMKVNMDETRVCGCGNKGCLEQYASATGIVRLTKQRLAADDAKTSLRSFPEVTAKDVFDAAKAGDAVAQELVEEVGRILGGALGSIAVVIDPEMFVIGGGVSRAGQILLDAVQKYFKERVFKSCQETKFVLASLGNDAGMYGCAKMIFNA